MLQDIPSSFTISTELSEIGGSLHGAPTVLEVDGRHGSRGTGALRVGAGEQRQGSAGAPPSQSQSSVMGQHFPCSLQNCTRSPLPLRKVPQISVEVLPRCRPRGGYLNVPLLDKGILSVSAAVKHGFAHQAL